jgi:hypothetical protein
MARHRVDKLVAARWKDTIFDGRHSILMSMEADESRLHASLWFTLHTASEGKRAIVWGTAVA